MCDVISMGGGGCLVDQAIGSVLSVVVVGYSGWFLLTFKHAKIYDIRCILINFVLFSENFPRANMRVRGLGDD